MLMRRYVMCAFSVLLLLSSPVKAEFEEDLPVESVEQVEEQVVGALKDAGVSQDDLDVANELVANAEDAGTFWDKDFFQKNKNAIKIGAAITAGAIVVSGGYFVWPRGESKISKGLGTSFEKVGGKSVRRSNRVKSKKTGK